MKKIKTILCFIFLFSTCVFFNNINAQTVFEHYTNNDIYEFLDEMASLKKISLNSAIKPYSRQFIADKLSEISKDSEDLNKRQLGELNFYLKDYNKELLPRKTYKKRFDLFYYKDSIFSITLNPILGYQHWVANNSANDNSHRWNGAEIHGYFTKNWGFYASLRDNREEKPLQLNNYLVQRIGSAYKLGAKYSDYSEMRGGISYTFKYGHVALIKDHLVWGNNYNGSNIFSGRTPSFAMIKLNLKPVKWFEFNYFHGWLSSLEMDSVRSYYTGSVKRTVYRQKEISANIFTFTPIKNLNLSFGNSIVYSDLGFNGAYYIPLFFFKSLDHTYSNSNHGGQNSQMFFDISSRNIKHLHLYGSAYVDEIAISRKDNDSTQTNFISLKAGARLSFSNFTITGEYTRTNPAVYKHYIASTTFESNKFNLGHYLGANAEQIYAQITWKPIKKLKLSASYTENKKGEDYIYTLGKNVSGLPFMKYEVFKQQLTTFKAEYQIINGCKVFAEYNLNDVKQIKTDDIVVKQNQSIIENPTYLPNTFKGDYISVGLYYGL